MARRIENRLYKVTTPNFKTYVEAESFDDLCAWCAQMEVTWGTPVTSVVEMELSGGTPRMSIKANKEYKQARKDAIAAQAAQKH